MCFRAMWNFSNALIAAGKNAKTSQKKNWSFPTNRKSSPGYKIYVFLYGIISIFTLYEGD